MRRDGQLTVFLPGQVLYKLAWSESMERDCATFCAKK